MNINVDTTTNRVVATGVQYDAAGNMINDGTQAYTFDEANRLKTAGNYFYTYSGLENKRVIAYNANGSRPSATINLYGPDGKRLGYYGFSSTNGWTTTTAGSFQNFLYLGNKALSYTEDRTGSAGNYFPYGNGYNVTGAESQAFGTYVQDESGLLYADQRHYNPGFGRFMTADRSNANIDYGNPVSWNRYAYTNGDPVNNVDPTGQYCGTNLDGSTYDFVDDNGDDGGPAFSCAASRVPYTIDALDLYQNGSDVFLNGRPIAEGGLQEDVGAELLLLQLFRTVGLIEGLASEGLSVWNLGNFERGRAIEIALGQNLPSRYPVIDSFVESTGVATSIKSLNLTAQTYQTGAAVLSKLTGYINSLASFDGAAYGDYDIGPGMITSRVLNVAIPDVGLTPAQSAAFNAAVSYGASVNVQVITTVVP